MCRVQEGLLVCFAATADQDVLFPGSEWGGPDTSMCDVHIDESSDVDAYADYEVRP